MVSVPGLSMATMAVLGAPGFGRVAPVSAPVFMWLPPASLSSIPAETPVFGSGAHPRPG